MKAIDRFSGKWLAEPGLEKWLDGHDIEYMRMIDETYVEPADKGYIYFKYKFENPLMGYLLTQNVCKSDMEKQQQFLEWIKKNSCVITQIGKKGGGKTGLSGWVCEQLKGAMPIYWFEMNPGLPKWIKCVDDWNMVQDGSLVIVNEAAVQYFSRDAMVRSSKDMAKLLMISRHHDLRIIFNSQLVSGADVKIHELSDAFLIKPMQMIDTADIEHSRTKTFFKYVTEMQPRNFNEVLFTNGEDWIRFPNPLPSFWSDAISRGYAKPKPDELVKIIRGFKKQDMDAKLIQKRLKVMNVALTEKEIKAI